MAEASSEDGQGSGRLSAAAMRAEVAEIMQKYDDQYRALRTREASRRSRRGKKKSKPSPYNAAPIDFFDDAHKAAWQEIPLHGTAGGSTSGNFGGSSFGASARKSASRSRKRSRKRRRPAAGTARSTPVASPLTLPYIDDGAAWGEKGGKGEYAARVGTPVNIESLETTGGSLGGNGGSGGESLSFPNSSARTYNLLTRPSTAGFTMSAEELAAKKVTLPYLDQLEYIRLQIERRTQGKAAVETTELDSTSKAAAEMKVEAKVEKEVSVIPGSDLVESKGAALATSAQWNPPGSAASALSGTLSFRV